MKKILIVTIVLALCIFSPVAYGAGDLAEPSYVNAFVYSSGSIRLSWDNSVSGATRFTIQRKTDSGPYTTLTTLPTSASTYNDSGITNGHTYTYRVFATSGSVSGEPTESYPIEYLYPADLSTKALSDSEVELIWSYPASNNIPETNYQTVIERRMDGTRTWETVATIPGTEVSHTDTDLSEATRYFYRIRTLTSSSAAYIYYPNNTVGQSATTMLKAPQNITAKIISPNSVELSWKDSSVKETGYRVERKRANGTYILLKTVSANAERYVDTTAINGEQYTYRVVPLSSTYQGTPSEEVVVPFLFPVSLQIEENYSSQMTLSWSYPGNGYITPGNSCVLIERREASSLNWELIHTTEPGETEYTDSGLEPGTRYYYRIRSRYNDDFTTDYFPSSAGIAEYTKLELKTGIHGYALSGTEIRLEWDENAAGSNTILLEKLGATGTFEPLASLSHTGYYVDTVSPGSVNTYRLKLRSSVVDSDYTPAVDITAETLTAVTNPAIKAIIPERIFITWEYKKAVESGFEIWRKAGANGAWELIGTTSRGQCMFSDENIMNGESYGYRIRAVKSNTIFSPFAELSPVLVSFSNSDGRLVISKSGDTLYLGWDDFSDMEEYYAVEYKTSVNDTWHVLDKLPKNTTLYRFIPAQGVDYTIRIRALSDIPIYESVSNEQFYSTKIPVTPSLKSPFIIGSNRVVLMWADLSDNEDEFVIYRKDLDFDDTYQEVGRAKANTVFFADASVMPDHTYAYIVRAKNAAGESFVSNEISVQTPLNIAFTDLGSHPWARDAVESLTSMGIVNGDGKGHYNPSGNVTRAEFIKLLVATFSFPETPIGSFRDVTPGDWYHRWIMTAYRNGIIEPDDDGLFHPDTEITREDIVYFSVRAIKAAGLSLEQPPLYILYKFRDYDEVSGYAQSAFAAMNYAGIINGIGSDRLGPKNPATRAEAATIIYRMLKVLEKQTADQQLD